MAKPIILNNDYAMTKTPEGWHVYGYIHSEDIPLGCVVDKFAGNVTLDTDAAMILLDAICSELGGCDFLKDARKDAGDATARAEATETEANRRREEFNVMLKRLTAAEADAERLRAQVAELREALRQLRDAIASLPYNTFGLRPTRKNGIYYEKPITKELIERANAAFRATEPEAATETSQDELDELGRQLAENHVKLKGLTERNNE